MLKVGQRASRKIAGYDYNINGGLEGRIEVISADTLGDNEKAALYPDGKLASVGMTMEGVIEDGMAQMSEKFKEMGGQVYVEAEAVKESNKVL